MVIGFRSLAFSCCVSAVLFGFYESIVLGVSGLDGFHILMQFWVGSVPGCIIGYYTMLCIASTLVIAGLAA